ncbi:unnamed protein product [Ceutorhynchus assimilis]|uniref:Beta-galactosidase n=1 Tax=Ceutorhynchus assimilis TaxID=467358 RepID=A0A9N9MSC4_9CUCU|nr:unnamed protein product [Ceutorhynchus assimilis]
MSLFTSCPVSASLPTNYEHYTSDGINQGLNANQSYFTLNDKLVRIYSGAMHYFRVPRASWRDRLKKLRAAGLNTVETYVPWSLHETQSGQCDFDSSDFEFDDFPQLEAFLKTAKEEDLFVILRTGTSICLDNNSSDSGLLKENKIGLRTSESVYLKYFNVLLTLLAAFQFTKGGPIIAFHIENQFGNQESRDKCQPDKAYLEQLRQLFINNGIAELMVISDSNACDNVLVLVNGASEQLKPTEMDRFGCYRMNISNVTLNQEAINSTSLDIIVKEWGSINDELFDQCDKISKGKWQGQYDFGNGGSEFEDFLHLEEFLKTAKEEDLFVILRPGPYICSEYNFGGFPAWLLREKTMGFRTSEPTYMKFVTRYFNILLTLLAAFQFTKGGPVIAFQVENEYGNQEAGDEFQPDKAYLEQLRQLFINNGIVELLVTSDSPLSHQDKGTLPGIFLQTANLGASVTEQLDKLEELQPGRPLMVMEYWVGWFDFWGQNHTGKSDGQTRRYLKLILDRNASFNAYMFLGGTNFAFNSGASLSHTFEAITTSYDYDSPLSENGQYTSKYHIFKELVDAANPVKTFIPDVPEATVPVAYDSVKLDRVIPFKTLLENNAPIIIESDQLLPMEKLDINNNSGQSNGYIVYRKENVDLEANSVLTIEGKVCDHVLVLVNGELIAPKQLKYASELDGFGFYRLQNSNVTLNREAIHGATLDIVVEEWGRMNGGKYNQYNNTFKGLWQGNVSINNQNIFNWKIVPFELKKQWVNELEGWQEYSSGLIEPAMYSSILNIDDAPEDTFVDIRGWGKGMVFVNGFPLGRYAAVGPQRTLYLPAPLLKQGQNRINFLEHFYAPGDGLVKFATKLIFEDVF